MAQVKSQAQLAAEMPDISGLSENKLAALLLKRKQQDYKDREYDSDDDIRKEQLTYDDKITFINLTDREVFSVNEEERVPKIQDDQAKTASTEKEEEQETKLPIVLHEREIMENIENFMVTIVCGETGSGKSTQIPQFIYHSAKASPWKFKNNSAEDG